MTSRITHRFFRAIQFLVDFYFIKLLPLTLESINVYECREILKQTEGKMRKSFQKKMSQKGKKVTQRKIIKIVR